MPIPTHIVTGFLGAGKTSFLNHLIASRPSERILVIENEVGSTNIDSKLLLEEVEDVMELTAGCLCCSLNDGLIDLLEAVSRRKGEFDRLIIETTGVADPESIAYPFIAHPAVGRDFDLRSMICLVDAMHISQWLQETEEARRQISFADVLLLNKTDMVPSAADLAAIRSLASGINPLAQVFEGDHGQFPGEEILAIQQLKEEGAVEPTQAVDAGHHHHHHDISTFTLTYQQPIDLRVLYQELAKILSVSRSQIYRIKGLIHVSDYPVQIVLQSVSNSIYLTDGQRWEEPLEERESKIVVIGKDLKKEAMEQVVGRALAKS
ncbi:MAG: GTP-binding protein [Bacteroidota bacterium]